MTYQICTRCIYDTEVPNISFNDQGVCNYCVQIDELSEQFPNDARGEVELQRLVDEMKRAGKGKK